MAVKIDLEGQNMMQALGITPERCEEICNAIEQIWDEHQDWNFGQVLNEAIKQHADENNRDNEAAFMSYVFGRHSGIVDGLRAGQEAAHVSRLFERVFGSEQTFSFSGN